MGIDIFTTSSSYLCIQRELSEVHLASGRHSEPLGVGDRPCGGDTDKPVRDHDLVQVRVLAVEKISVWPPDFGQKLPVHW